MRSLYALSAFLSSRVEGILFIADCHRIFEYANEYANDRTDIIAFVTIVDFHSHKSFKRQLLPGRNCCCSDAVVCYMHTT